MKDIANRPSEGKLISMTVEEAAAKYDANPAAFGDMTREQYLKDTADYNKRYMDTIKRIYPEAQNEILADALQALGAMFVAENKGEAFTKTFNDLQKAGMKRRDARRIALGKAGLENLKSDKATLDKIRQLPKQRRDAINEMIEIRAKQMERKDISELRKATTGLRKAEKGKAERYRPKTAKLKDLSKASIEGIQSYLTNNTLIDFKGRIENDPTFRKGIAERLSSTLDVGDLTDEIEEVFKQESYLNDVKIEIQKIKRANPDKNVDTIEVVNLAALRALQNFKAARKALSTTDIERRSQSK